MLMVMVTWSMLYLQISSTISGSAKPLVDRHGLMSGASSCRRRKVSKAFFGLASASPGPAMPRTVICGIALATASTFFTACSGVSLALTTPGRLSLLQSYLRLQ